MVVILNRTEIRELLLQDPSTRGDGGFQSLLVSLQEKTNLQTGELDLTKEDLDRIQKYAFDYENGGWQNRLKKIFGRVLGANLGRV